MPIAASIATPPPPPPTNSPQLTEEKTFALFEKQKPIINKTSSPQLVTPLDGTNSTSDTESILLDATFTAPVRQVRLLGKAFFETSVNGRRPVYVYVKKFVAQTSRSSFIGVGVEGETAGVKAGRRAVFLKEQQNHSAVKYDVTITPHLQAEYNKLRKELISSTRKRPRMAMPIIGLCDGSKEISSVAAPCEDVSYSKMLSVFKKSYEIKIIFYKKNFLLYAYG